MQTALYRKQHGALLHAVGDVDAALTLQKGAEAVRFSLTRLASLLAMHLKLEDDVLYPQMKGHADPIIAGLAARYQAEMGGLAAAFTSFYDRWRNAGVAAFDRTAFALEWDGVKAALGKRIDQEDTELYPLVDRSVSLT